MKNLFLISFTILFTTVMYSQNLEFKVGTEYRITPIGKQSNTSLPTGNVYYSEHRQLTGTAFNYSVGYLTKNGFGFGFSHSFQYSHIYYEQTENKNDKSVNGLITDYKLYIKQEFKIKNNTLFLELGGSLMNNGTSYTNKESRPIPNSDESIIFIDNEDFSYTALNITAGYIYNKFDIGVGMYFTSGYSNLINAKKFKLPYIKMNYIIY